MLRTIVQHQVLVVTVNVTTEDIEVSKLRCAGGCAPNKRFMQWQNFRSWLTYNETGKVVCSTYQNNQNIHV